MTLPFRPAIRREYEEDFLFAAPMMPWTFRDTGVGGSALSAAGVPVSYVIREDDVALLTLRVYEEELAAVREVLRAVRAALSVPFIFAFDQDDPATEYEVYLHAPTWPQDIEWKRDDEYRGIFTVSIEIRRADGLPFAISWVEQEDVS